MGYEEANEVQFAVLGPLEVTRRGRAVDLGGPKPRSVLAMLLLSPGSTRHIEALVDGLWGEASPPTAVKTIHKYVSQLRKRLGDVIVTRPGGYTLVVAPGSVDAHRFEELVDLARDHPSPKEIVALLTEALSLWRGEAFVDLVHSDAAVAERARLEEKRLSATEDLIDAELALGHHARVVARLEQLVTEHPLRERLWGQLMTALYRSGRQTEALDAYQRLRSALVDEFAIEPSSELQDLQKRMLDHDPDLELPASDDSGDGHGVVPTNLPAQLTSFVGRALELQAIGALLHGARLVTLTGAAGSGKTRLALEAAGASDVYPDGVWLVDLVALTSPDQVAGSFAAPLRLGEQPGRPMEDVLAEYFMEKKAFIVVDNCEHLIEPVAELVATLLGAANGLHVLATSREPLALPGEVIYEVAPLTIPAPREDLQVVAQCDSVRLFVERARAIDTGFHLTTGNADAVTDVCRRLDGIPLALELAAAMLRSFGPHQLVGLLEEHFDVLAVAPRTVHARHRTLRAAIDWSYDLLSDPERTLFRRLAVFHGGFDLDAAKHVCFDDALSGTDVLALLPALVTKSLVAAIRQPDGVTRYRLLETLRDYGLRELDAMGETKEMQRRHAVYFCDLAEQADQGMRGPDQEEWFDRLRSENGNIRAALAWTLDSGEMETGLRLAAAQFSFAAVFWFWDMRGSSPAEGLAWLRDALARSEDVSDAVRAKALAAAGFLAESQGAHEDAHEYGERSLALYRTVGSETGAAVATLLLGEVAHYRGQYEDASRLIEESLEVFTRLDDKWKIAWANHRLGMVARLRGDYDRAHSLHHQSLELFRLLGDNSRVAYSLWALGVVARYQGDYTNSVSSCEESLKLFERRGDRSGIAHVRATLGDVARLQGDGDRAVALYEECRAEFQELGDRRCVASSFANLGAVAQNRSDDLRAESLYQKSLAIRTELTDVVGVAECLDGLARANSYRGRLVRAVKLMAAAEASREEAGAALAGPERLEHEAEVASLRTALGTEAFDEAWSRGRAMQLEDAVTLALAGAT